jgi:hypothetical protein
MQCSLLQITGQILNICCFYFSTCCSTEAHLGPTEISFQFEITNSRIRNFTFNSLFQILEFDLTDLNCYNRFVEFVKMNIKICFNELNSKLRILKSVLTYLQIRYDCV